MTNEPEKLVEKFIADNKVTYPILIEQGYKSAKALKLNGYPHAFLVDTKGKVIWEGHPVSLNESVIEEALKGARVPGTKLPDALKSLEPMLTKREFGKAYQATKNLLAGALSDEAKAAAQGVLTSIETDVSNLLASADTAINEKNFFAAQESLRTLTKSYATVPGVAETADIKLRDLSANVEARKSIKASEQLAKAIDLESAQDFDKAYAMLLAITTTAAGTMPAASASSHMRDIEAKGMLGFDKKCAACKEQGKACPKHKKKPK